jgi:hypothetical protein
MFVDKSGVTLDGNIITVASPGTTVDIGDYNLTIFRSLGSPKSGKFKCSYFKMWDDGVLVRDFIPVIAPDGEGCMFDKVSQKLFRNSGTGTFKTNKD